MQSQVKTQYPIHVGRAYMDKITSTATPQRGPKYRSHTWRYVSVLDSAQSNPRSEKVKADKVPMIMQMTNDGTIPDKEAPYGIANMEAPIRFLIRFRIDPNKDALW